MLILSQEGEQWAPIPDPADGLRPWLWVNFSPEKFLSRTSPFPSLASQAMPALTCFSGFPGTKFMEVIQGCWPIRWGVWTSEVCWHAAGARLGWGLMVGDRPVWNAWVTPREQQNQQQGDQYTVPAPGALLFIQKKFNMQKTKLVLANGPLAFGNSRPELWPDPFHHCGALLTAEVFLQAKLTLPSNCRSLRQF